MIRQQLDFGPIHMERSDDEPSLYILSGQKMYLLGATSGALVPIGREHRVGEMGGLWAHPVKFVDGWYTVFYPAANAAPRRLTDCTDFRGRLSDVTFGFTHDDLLIERTDFVAETDAALWGLLAVTNHGNEAWHGEIGMVARVNVLPAWFSGWETGETKLHQEQGVVVGYDTLWQGRWGLTYGSSPGPDAVVFDQADGKATVELRYSCHIASGETRHFELLLTADHQNGHSGAHALWVKLIGQGVRTLEQKRARYAEVAWGGVQLETPDEAVNHEYALAKINLHMLYADYGPYLPGFFLAGVPEYPQLFGCDTAYSAAGAAAAGFTTEIKASLTLLGERARMACGRVPHELTTNGRTFNPGNTQETPQFALAVWDYVRWTGDLSFLREMYPVCREGVMEYVSSLWDGDGDGYPWGDAMVERPGMGSLKLDSACYLYAAWNALAQMATVLERPEAQQYVTRATEWLTRFEHDWWLPDQQLYADSLHSDLRPQLDGHWTQVVPVQLGIAAPERGAMVLDELHRSFTNEYGLMHTRGREDSVWTLPTALLALADVRYGRVAAAVEQLHHIALTTRNGMLGAFEELIPAGLCFMQLWSAATYVQCVVEGLLGLDPLAHAHQLTIRPALPQEWETVTLRGLWVGEHQLDITATHTCCRITHVAGSTPINLRYGVRGISVAAVQNGNTHAPVALETTPDGDVLSFAVAPTGTVFITHEHDHARVEFADRQGSPDASSKGAS